MRHLRLYILLSLTLALFGCANDQTDQSKTEHKGGNSFSITDFSNRVIHFEEVPKNIVTLGNGETDIIYALGHEVIGRPTGDAVIADSKDALEIGSTHSVDLEKITSLQPDVVLGDSLMNQKDLVSIEGINSKMVLTHADSVKEINQQITLFGEMLHEESKAAELIQSIEEKQADIKASVDKTPRVLLVYGAPGTNMLALSNSLAGNLLELAGGENIAKDYPSLDAYPQYAQLNTERIIEANPEIVLLMTHGDPEAVKKSFMKDISSTAGWDKLDAIKNDKLYTLPPDLFGTNPGTRVTDALTFLHDILNETSQ